MASAILLHMRTVEQALAALSAPQAFTFAAACAERAWPIYERVSQGQEWDRRSILRAALDAVWSWLLGAATRPDSVAAQCESAVVDEALPDAYFVANNVFGLLDFVEKDQPFHCHLCAEMNLDQISRFLYGFYHLSYSEESEAVVDNHELCLREVNRQQEDIQSLSQTFSVAVVADLRSRSKGQSIYGQLWK
jgi:hypothetical protein